MMYQAKHVEVYSTPTHQVSLNEGPSEFDLFIMEEKQAAREMFLGSQNLKTIESLQGIAGYCNSLVMSIENNPAKIPTSKQRELQRELLAIYDKLDFLESDYMM